MNDDTRLDCSDMPSANDTQIIALGDKKIVIEKICPMMSRPIPTRRINERGYYAQFMEVQCVEEGCAMWIEEHCGLMANIVKIEAAPKVESVDIGKVMRERPRSGIGSDPIVNKSKE